MNKETKYKNTRQRQVKEQIVDYFNIEYGPNTSQVDINVYFVKLISELTVKVEILESKIMEQEL